MLGPTSVALASSIRRRFVPRTSDARALLEAVCEVEPVSAEALPPAVLAAHAVAALAARAPGLALERVAVAVRGLAHAGLPTRVAGIVERVGESRASARLRVRQPAGSVLEVTAFGSLGRQSFPVGPDALPEELAQFAEALHEDVERYRGAAAWPVELVVALAAAGVEAEEQDGLARLLRLTVDLVGEAPIEERLRFAIDGVKPIAGDMARVVFRVTTAGSRRPGPHQRPTLVARGDAIIVSALARSAAMTLRRAA